ncbi:MAG: hypothetical protein AAF532_07700 [Planctomycetota bacterium]
MPTEPPLDVGLLTIKVLAVRRDAGVAGDRGNEASEGLFGSNVARFATPRKRFA